MDSPLCGATTANERPCRWPRDRCPWHQGRRRAVGGAPGPSRAEAMAPPPSAEPVRAPLPPVILDSRDLRALGWWIVEQAVGGGLEAGRASAVGGILRTLATLGPEPLAAEEALREVELRGRVIHGQPPRPGEEAELAAAIFSDEALAEFRRWQELRGEGDRDDRLEPLGGVE